MQVHQTAEYGTKSEKTNTIHYGIYICILLAIALIAATSTVSYVGYNIAQKLIQEILCTGKRPAA